MNDDNELRQRADQRLSQGHDQQNGRPETDQTPATQVSGKYAMFMVFGLWLVIMSFGTLWAKRWFDERNAAQDPVSGYTEAGKLSVELKAGPRGHYLVNGKVNGETVPFLVDTGATSIALSESVAKNLGLTFGYPITVSTANGSATAYNTVLTTVEIGALRLNEVQAFISPGLEDGTALLGMTFLRHFELNQRDGTLSIRTP